MRKKNSTPTKNLGNYVLYSLLLITLVSCLYVEIVGDKYEQLWIKQFNDFLIAKEFNQNQQHENAASILSHLLKEERYKNSFPVIYSYAMSQYALGNYSEAYEFLEKAQEIRPMVLLDYIFDLQMGEILFQMERYDEARKYFLTAIKIEPQIESNEIIMNMLKDIENSKESSGGINEKY